MDEKKQIIINEIEHWKKSRLLPEVYCDFLLSLYSEGEEKAISNSRFPSSYIKQGIYLFIILSFIIATTVVIYITEFTPFMQMGILTVSLFLSLGFAIFYFSKRNPISHIYIVLATFMSFFYMINISDLFFQNDANILGGLIAVLCIIWFFAGWKWKLYYLYIAGGTGIILFFIFQFVMS